MVVVVLVVVVLLLLLLLLLLLPVVPAVRAIYDADSSRIANPDVVVAEFLLRVGGRHTAVRWHEVTDDWRLPEAAAAAAAAAATVAQGAHRR